MGEVYRARDTRLERTVAIKILPALLSADLVRKQRFEREAKTISGLNHPSICTLHDIGSLDGVDSNFAVGAVNPLFETRAYRSISGGFDVAADGQASSSRTSQASQMQRLLSWKTGTRG